jgi:hypothetical protein
MKAKYIEVKGSEWPINYLIEMQLTDVKKPPDKVTKEAFIV